MFCGQEYLSWDNQRRHTSYPRDMSQVFTISLVRKGKESCLSIFTIFWRILPSLKHKRLITDCQCRTVVVEDHSIPYKPSFSHFWSLTLTTSSFFFVLTTRFKKGKDNNQCQYVSASYFFCYDWNRWLMLFLSSLSLLKLKDDGRHERGRTELLDMRLESVCVVLMPAAFSVKGTTGREAER